MAVPTAHTFPFLDDYNGSSGNEDDMKENNDRNDGDDGKRHDQHNGKVHLA